MLLRFYDISSGSILIDGFEIDEYNVHCLRKSIGYVMQEPNLLNLSIKENIKYGKQDATDEEVYKAAVLANALEFIESPNQEELTGEELRERQDLRLKMTLEEFKDDYPKVKELEEPLKGLSDKQRDLVLEVFNRSDEAFLNLINENATLFMTMVETEGSNEGVRWDEVIIQFEWLFKFDVLLNKMTNKSVKEVMVKAFKELKYCFNEEMVSDWLANIKKDDLDF